MSAATLTPDRTAHRPSPIAEARPVNPTATRPIPSPPATGARPPGPPGPDEPVVPARSADTDDGRAEGERTGRAPAARCADGNGTLTGLFFSDDVVDIARAKAMCSLCPLRAGCLAGALEREEPWGVWGGELLSGGRIIANKRPCGRPPKHPRPEIVYDEMGPVGVVA